MDEITKQITEMAEKVEKSTQSPNERLFAIIKSLGPAGLKDKLATLSDDEKLVLKAALEEMTLKKAVEFDKEAQSAKMIQGKFTDTIIQEDIASDDADEKLVKPAAAVMNHQGTPTDGWEGQVIKSIQDNEEQLDQLIEKAMAKCNDDKMVMKKLKDKGMDEGKVQGALDKYKAKMKKSDEDIEKGKMKEAREDAKEKIMQMEEKEHGTKDPKKLVQAEKDEKKMMKKSDEDLEKGKALPEKSNPEVNQVGDAPELEGGKQMAKKSPAPNIEDNAKANKKNMTKSCSWEDENRLFKSNALGRNHSFNLETFVNETLKLENQQPTEIKKSEGKEDINDIIEKGGDTTWDDIAKSEAIKNHKTSGQLIKSFDDVADIASAMGITVEEAKKILGE